MRRNVAFSIVVGFALLGLCVGCTVAVGPVPPTTRTAMAHTAEAREAHVSRSLPSPTLSATDTRVPTPYSTPTSSTPHPSATAAPSMTATSARVAPERSLPTPPILLKGEEPEVYLLVNGAKRPIVDWETFLHLGYQEKQIVTDPSLVSTYPEGPPITRLLTGSGEAVYWMQDGIRWRVRDLDAFGQRDLDEEDISRVPDRLLASFPLKRSAVRGPRGASQAGAVAEWLATTYHPLDGGPRLTELYVVQTTGCCPTRLTYSEGNAENVEPAWSPDGTQIAYTGCPGGSSGDCAIQVMAVNGGTPRRLTDPLTHLPTWSPDGARIAFWSSAGGNILVIDAEGNEAHKLASGRLPAWTPGGQIAFWAGDGAPYTLSMMREDGTEVGPLDGPVTVYDQRYYPWREQVWTPADDPLTLEATIRQGF